MIKRGKYFVPPPYDGTDFKELFKRTVSTGAGRPVDKDGFPIGQWTPELLAEAISNIEANKTGVDLRTVQHWFDENDKGISPDNIRWLARVFGCGDPDASSDWQVELSAANRRLVAKRRERKKAGTEIEAPQSEAPPPSRKNRFNLPRRSEALFCSQSRLNLPASVWVGCVTLGFMAYIMGVHSVTYSPIAGLDKQVGFFWAPNWTVLEMVVLPLFLATVSSLLGFWKNERKSVSALAGAGQVPDTGWAAKVETYWFSHWAVLFICFLVVFLLQWSGVHMRALMQGDFGDLMMDWNLMAIVRPEVISIPEATVLSMLAFLYTAGICFLFLTGLVLLHTLAQDFNDLCGTLVGRPDHDSGGVLLRIGAKLLCGIFRCTVLRIWVATCIKLQATYLLSDGENIVNWLLHDTQLAFGLHHAPSGWLDQMALAHFTSFLLLLASCSAFIFATWQMHPILAGTSSPDRPNQSVPWVWMGTVLLLLVANFLLIGQFPGFSILLFVAMLTTIYGLYDPMFGRAHPA